MPQLISFAAWLARAEDSWFTGLCETRRDLMRSDTASISGIAAAAASRTGVAAALESLSTPQLRVAQRAAVAARVDPAVPASALAAPDTVLTRLLELGLLWPAEDAGIADPLTAPVYRIHSEAVGLLPTSAADRAAEIPWLRSPEPAAVTPTGIPQSLVDNAQAAAAAGIVGEVLSVLDAFDDAPASQLTSGGVGKRDLQLRGRAAGLEYSRAVFLTELAGQAELLGIGGKDTDPQWLPTVAYDAFLDLDRAEAHSRLLQTWLLGTVDTTHVLAGRTGRGERIHSLSSVAGSARLNPYAGFPSSLPALPYLKYLVLAQLAAAAETAADASVPTPGEADASIPAQGEAGASATSQAIPNAALFERLQWTRPMAAALSADTVDQILREAQAFGLVCSPLGDSEQHALTGIGLRLTTELMTVMCSAPAPAGFDPGRVEVSAEIRTLVAGLLPEPQTSVLVQSDLTAVATGPVAPRLHAELDDIADVDTRGQGTVYRFTAESISRALRSGMSVDAIHELLTRVSSTGIPQPLQFLIDEAAARLRRVQVAPARAVVVVDDPADLEPLLADPQLLAAGLQRVSSTVAVAKVPQDRLAALLEAAGQPTLRHHAASEAPPRAARPRTLTPVSRRSLRIPEAELPAFIEGLRASRSQAAADPADSPLGILDVLREAAAAGTTVAVTVVGSDGKRRRIALRPTQVTTGRVRGIREAAGRDTEIALGISRIAAAEPWKEGM